jgi:hypothetical protein
MNFVYCDQIQRGRMHSAAGELAMDQRELHLRTQISRLQQQLSPATLGACRQTAWHVGHQLSFIMQRVDWEAHLVHEIQRDLAARGVPPFVYGTPIAAIIMAIAAILAIIGTLIGSAVGKKAGGKDEAAKKVVEERLFALTEKLLVRFERQGDRTFRPIGRP